MYPLIKRKHNKGINPKSDHESNQACHDLAENTQKAEYDELHCE